MTAQERAEFYAGLEKRLLALIERNEAAMREFNDEFYRAERAKQRIEAEYQLRRMQRLAAERA